MAKPWPACWVHFDPFLEPSWMCSARRWARIIPPNLEEGMSCCPQSNASTARMITNPQTPPASSGGASPYTGDPDVCQ